MSALSDVYAARLTDYLLEMHKHYHFYLTLEDVVATTVADVIVVVEGYRSVDDYKPDWVHDG
jgi:hypothetical protein